MSFKSIEYLIFFPIIVALYFLIPFRWRWALLLAGSYYFYMSWKPEYAILLFGSTLIDYIVGLLIEKTEKPGARKSLLLVSLITNFGLLFAFKYFNFFNESLRTIFNSLSIQWDTPAFKLLLPIGISFYVFQSVSYVIDVYRRQRGAEKHFGIFALYISFFPQLVAGPIERSNSLLPQFKQEFSFDFHRIADGLKIMLIGFFKKVVIADRLALYVDSIYTSPLDFSSASLILATYFFAFQIYCDFSGYSDIAIGSAKIMGYNLRDNFNRPYIATSIREFWKRWHISLTSWFRDYLYFPIGGSRVPNLRNYFNIFTVFLVSGLWHGANWTFVIWGALHGLYQMIGKATTNFRESVSKALGIAKYPRVQRVWQIFFVFQLVALSWIFFRAKSAGDAFAIIAKIFSEPFSISPLLKTSMLTQLNIVLGIVLIVVLLLLQKLQNHEQMRFFMDGKPLIARWAVLYAIIFIILFAGVFEAVPFIYFQF